MSPDAISTVFEAQRSESVYRFFIRLATENPFLVAATIWTLWESVAGTISVRRLVGHDHLRLSRREVYALRHHARRPCRAGIVVVLVGLWSVSKGLIFLFQLFSMSNQLLTWRTYAFEILYVPLGWATAMGVLATIYSLGLQWEVQRMITANRRDTQAR